MGLKRLQWGSCNRNELSDQFHSLKNIGIRYPACTIVATQVECLQEPRLPTRLYEERLKAEFEEALKGSRVSNTFLQCHKLLEVLESKKRAFGVSIREEFAMPKRIAGRILAVLSWPPLAPKEATEVRCDKLGRFAEDEKIQLEII